MLAHTGFPATVRALERMAAYPNLYADITPVWDHPLQLSAEEIGRFPGRFLFGSDAPNNPVPAAEQAKAADRLGLPAEELDLLMGGAAERLVA